jgi:hypothetical protein
MSKQKTAVQILVDSLIKLGYLHSNEFGQSPKVIELINQAKEIEKEYYTEFEVLQLLLKLQQTESYDNLYDWFEENKKRNIRR